MRFPVATEEESKNQKRFKVYLEYLKSISDILDNPNFKEREYLKKLEQSSAYQAIQQKSCDKEKIKQILRNAWATEIQLAFTAKHEILVAYSNQWASVQLYYCVYLALCALLLAMNDSQTNYDSHHTALSKISSKIKSTPGLYPKPWNLTYDGDPEIDKEIIQLNNWADEIVIANNSPLSSNQSFLVPYARFLKTTRQWQLDDRREKWLKENKRYKKLPQKIRQQIKQNLRPTTFFDCLYRLRIKANYKDVDLFLGALEIENWARNFNDALNNISRHTLQLIESLISKYIGESNFLQLVNDFKIYIKDDNCPVGKRWPVKESKSRT